MKNPNRDSHTCEGRVVVGRSAALIAALFAVALTPGPARAGLLSYQSLDNDSGLTLNGDAAISTGNQGKFGEALALDGTGDWAQVNAGSGITGGTVRTVSAWVWQETGATGIQTPVGLGVNGNGSKWDVDIDNPNGGLEVGVGGGRNTGSGLTGLTGSWIMVVTTLPVASGTVGDAKTYLNGVVTNASGGTRPIDTTNTTFLLGVSANGAAATAPQFTNGLVDEVAIWNEALTADEIKAFYDIGESVDLGYTADVFDALKQVHDAGTGWAEANGLIWLYASGLSGPAGLSGTAGNYTLVLDATAGTGLTGAPPATVTWGGAGSVGSPELWDSANNGDPTHWNRATPPNLSGLENAVINGGGIQKGDALTISGGTVLTLNSGAFVQLGPVAGGLTVNSGGSLVINSGTFTSWTNFVTLAGAESSLDVVSGSFVFDAQTTFGFGMNNGAKAFVRAGAVIESDTFFNSNNSTAPAGGTFVIDGGTLLASGPEANPVRAFSGVKGGGYDFTGVGGTIQIDDFTGGDLTAYLDGLATTGFFKINGTTVSGFGPTNQVGGLYLALTDSGTSGSLVLTAAGGGFASWIGGFAVGAEDGLDDNPDKGILANGLEYLLGGNPTIPNDTALPVLGTDASDLILTFDRDDQCIGFLDVVVEVSTDLVNWPVEDQIVIGVDTGSSGTGVTITDEGATDAVEVRIPQDGDPKKYARIRVRLPAS